MDACLDGQEALDYLDSAEYDVVLLDIMMPKKSGLEVLRALRKKGRQTPVLLLTAKDSIEDRVDGLDAGADDYLVKPFAFEELMARIRVMLRKKSGQSSNLLSVGGPDPGSGNPHSGAGRAADFLSPPGKFALLRYLVMNQGMILSRDQIEQHIWNYDYEGSSNMIDVYIRYLRKKIDDPFEKKLIHTVRGAGYVLREEEKRRDETNLAEMETDDSIYAADDPADRSGAGRAAVPWGAEGCWPPLRPRCGSGWWRALTCWRAGREI